MRLLPLSPRYYYYYFRRVIYRRQLGAIGYESSLVRSTALPLASKMSNEDKSNPPLDPFEEGILEDTTNNSGDEKLASDEEQIFQTPGPVNTRFKSPPPLDLRGSSTTFQTFRSSNVTVNPSIPEVPTFASLRASVPVPYADANASINATQAEYATLFVAPSKVASYNQLGSANILCPISKRNANGPKMFEVYAKAATEPIEEKFGAENYMVVGMEAVDSGDQIAQQYIQQRYVSNTAKLKEVYQRILDYDMFPIVRVPTTLISDDPQVPFSQRFGLVRVYLFSHAKSIPWKVVLVWQLAVNLQAMGPDHLVSSQWLYQFLHASCTPELRKIIDDMFMKLDHGYQGGIVYGWMLCNQLFKYNRDTAAALKKFIKLFETKGLRRYKGENVNLAREELLVVCERLSEVDDLPKETPVDILTGLTLCSVEEFRTLFESFLQDAKKQALLTLYEPEKVNILNEIQLILSNALEAYCTLCQSGNWNVPKNHKLHFAGKRGDERKSNPCWNCGKLGCTPNTCKQPRDDAKIAENRRKYYEGRGKGKDAGKKLVEGNYEREKWSTPAKGGPGVRYIGGVPHAYCGKKCNGSECGWNTTHSSKYHQAWKRDPSFDLAAFSPNHELCLAKKASNSGTSSTASSSLTATNTTGNGKQELLAKISVIEDSIHGDEARSALNMIKMFLN